MHFGHESRAITMLFLNETIPLAIPYHSFPIPMSMQCICKILLKFVYSFLGYWPKMHFGHKSRAITLLFLNEIIPLAISYHSSPIPMSMLSLKKIGKKVLKLDHANQALMEGQTDRWTDRGWTDRRTDGHSKFRGYNTIPRHFFCVAGYNNVQNKNSGGRQNSYQNHIFFCYKKPTYPEK